ncbi:MAG TPA: DUF2247 family protein [Jatrophihabitantaceae bacterium]|jgi:hypothetical protein|nr:DUF2247 family protein [Jatrophihabitantaceae bacterium]
MTSRLVSFVVPSEFVTAHAVLTPAELGTGFIDGWLDAHGVVQVALAKLEKGIPLSDVEDRIALLLTDQYDELPDLVAELFPEVSSRASEPTAVWLFIALAWVIAGPSGFDNPQQVIDMLYADFGYPDEVEALVSYMPAPPDSESSPEAIRHRWVEYLDRKSAEYSMRTNAMTHPARPSPW